MPHRLYPSFRNSLLNLDNLLVRREPLVVGVDLASESDLTAWWFDSRNGAKYLCFYRDSRPMLTVVGTDISYRFYATECTCAQPMPLEVAAGDGTTFMTCSHCRSFIGNQRIDHRRDESFGFMGTT